MPRFPLRRRNPPRVVPAWREGHLRHTWVLGSEPGVLSDEVVRLQTQLRAFSRTHGLPSPRAGRNAWRCAMFALALKSEDACCEAERLCAELDAAMAASIARARAALACGGRGGDCERGGTAAAPRCRHLDLEKLAASSK